VASLTCAAARHLFLTPLSRTASRCNLALSTVCATLHPTRSCSDVLAAPIAMYHYFCAAAKRPRSRATFSSSALAYAPVLLEKLPRTAPYAAYRTVTGSSAAARSFIAVDLTLTYHTTRHQIRAMRCCTHLPCCNSTLPARHWLRSELPRCSAAQRLHAPACCRTPASAASSPASFATSGLCMLLPARTRTSCLLLHAYLLHARLSRRFHATTDGGRRDYCCRLLHAHTATPPHHRISSALTGPFAPCTPICPTAALGGGRQAVWRLPGYATRKRTCWHAFLARHRAAHHLPSRTYYHNTLLTYTLPLSTHYTAYAVWITPAGAPLMAPSPIHMRFAGYAAITKRSAAHLAPAAPARILHAPAGHYRAAPTRQMPLRTRSINAFYTTHTPTVWCMQAGTLGWFYHTLGRRTVYAALHSIACRHHAVPRTATSNTHLPLAAPFHHLVAHRRQTSFTHAARQRHYLLRVFTRTRTLYPAARCSDTHLQTGGHAHTL